MSTTTYDASLTMQDAVKQYFAVNHFGNDGGYNDKFVELKVGPMVMFLPNVPSRVRAVRVHDLHHVLTGYQTNWIGEFEISAWELATNCSNYGAALVLNLSGLISGLLLAPKRVTRAFVRGRRSANLYRVPYEEQLSKRVGELRSALRLDDEAAGAVRLGEVLALLGYVALGIPVGLVMLALSILSFPLALGAMVVRRLRPSSK
jgi:hypothetical protein